MTRDPSGYCPIHRRESSGWADYNAGRTSSERGYGAAWRKVRAWVLRRDQGLCQVCAAAGRVTAAGEVDHIISKAEAARLKWSRHQVDQYDNLQAICSDCHKAKTAMERSGR